MMMQTLKVMNWWKVLLSTMSKMSNIFVPFWEALETQDLIFDEVLTFLSFEKNWLTENEAKNVASFHFGVKIQTNHTIYQALRDPEGKLPRLVWLLQAFYTCSSFGGHAYASWRQRPRWAYWRSSSRCVTAAHSPRDDETRTEMMNSIKREWF